MLDHTHDQRLHDLIVHVSPLLSGPASCVPSPDPDAEEPAPPPFSPAKVERILDRVYHRIADDSAAPADPRLRELIAGAISPAHSICSPFGAGKVRRILDCVQSRLAMDTMVEPTYAEEPSRAGMKAVVWAGLRAAAAAFFVPRPDAAEASLLSNNRGAKPLADGPGSA
jgi:hypothetical protein